MNKPSIETKEIRARVFSDIRELSKRICLNGNREAFKALADIGIHLSKSFFIDAISTKPEHSEAINEEIRKATHLPSFMTPKLHKNDFHNSAFETYKKRGFGVSAEINLINPRSFTKDTGTREALGYYYDLRDTLGELKKGDVEKWVNASWGLIREYHDQAEYARCEACGEEFSPDYDWTKNYTDDDPWMMKARDRRTSKIDQKQSLRVCLKEVIRRALKDGFTKLAKQ